MKSLTQRGFHGNYSSKNSTYRNYSSFREAFDHPMYEHGFRSSVLGYDGTRERTVDNSRIICNTRVYPANASAKEEK